MGTIGGKRRVCLFCEIWESGGIEAFLCNVLTRMDRVDLEIDLTVAQLGKSIFTQKLQTLGIRVVELSGNPRNLRDNHRQFYSLLVRQKYDVVHLNLYHGVSLYYAKLAAKAGVPIIIAHSHNTALRKTRTRLIKQMIHRIAKRIFAKYATDFWACSGKAATFLFPKILLKRQGYTFIPNGIDIERFRFNQMGRKAMQRKLGIENKLVIGNVGRLCYQKNQRFLLEIFAEIKKKRWDSVLLIVGEGEDKPALKKKANQLNIENSIIFYGTTDNVEQLYWVMDVFAFPSRFEGLGIAVVEAQAAGLPVVCSERIPPEAIISSDTAVIPLAAGADQWANNILSIKPSDRMAGNNMVKQAGFHARMVAQQVNRRWFNGEEG